MLLMETAEAIVLVLQKLLFSKLFIALKLMFTSSRKKKGKNKRKNEHSVLTSSPKEQISFPGPFSPSHRKQFRAL